MFKKFFNGMLIAALFVGLGMNITSCKDDDDDNNKTEEQKQEEAQEKASAFWDVMAQLVSIDDVTDDYEGKTFEPTYGIVDESDPLTRIVNTNDMRTAAERFANLIQATDIDENTPSYTWSNDEIGTMTYTRVGTPNEWATVDVDIKALPHLKKIIYRVGGEGENGDFGGKAWYRFGDVIRRTVPVVFDEKKNYDNRGNVYEYWICVRPSFSKEGKGDSHWVCVNTVTDKNYEYYKSKSTGVNYWLPYSLGYDKENMQNFAELLWAICYPEQWHYNADKYHTDGRLWGFSGLPIFADFKKANLNLHNTQFWKNVQNAWKRAEIAEAALNMPNLDAVANILPQDGVHLLYKGYKWKWSISWNCELFEAIFTNGTKNEEKNMHHLEFKDWKEDMKEVKLNVMEMGQTLANYGSYFRNDRKHRWVIRHATGKELAANGKYDPKQQINGVEDVYRYYRDVVPTTDLSGDPEETEAPKKIDTPVVGCVIGEQGNFYVNKDAAIAANETPKAMVVYLGGNKRVEHGANWNGLAIALQDEYDGQTKSNSNSTSNTVLCTHNAPTFEYLSSHYRGLSATAAMLEEEGHQHPVAWHVYEPFLEGNNNFSNWFIPSSGQWCLALEGMGYGKYVLTGEENLGMKDCAFDAHGRWLWQEAGLPEAALKEGGNYMTTTERNYSFDKENASGYSWQFVMDKDNPKFQPVIKTSKFLIRTFVAFKYGNGGTEDFAEPWARTAEPIENGTIGMDGYFYRKGEHAFAATGYAPAAYILYVDHSGNNSVKVGDKNYRGYAVALTDKSVAEKQFLGTPWASQQENAGKVKTTLTDDIRQQRGLSNWFVPSMQQWKTGIETAFGAQFDQNMAVIENKQGTTWQEYIFDEFFQKQDIIDQAGLTYPYWTSTEVEGDNSKAYVIELGSKENIKFYPVGKTETRHNNRQIGLRPFIAF